MSNEAIQGKPLQNILIVDEDEKLIQHLANLLSKFYSLKTATNGNAGLELLQKGYRPAVIMASQTMQGLTGGQLLAESMKYIPESIRIILTSLTQPKEIVPAMSQGKAYMYLQKPVNDLQFIQSIRNSLDHYESQQKVKGLQKNLAMTLTELKKMKSETTAVTGKTDGGIVNLLSEIIALAESYYYSYHTQNVVQIVKTLGAELQLPEGRLLLLEAAAKIHLIVYTAMPERFRLRDPHEIDESELNEYFVFFRKPLNVLRNNKELEQPVKIIENMWERADGKGFPTGIDLEDLSIESQILSLAVLYDNITYRLGYDKLTTLRQSDELIQTQVETNERHNDAMKFIYRNSAGFDKDLMRIFTFVEKNKTNSALVPKRGDLKLRNKEYIAKKVPVNTESSSIQEEERVSAVVKIGDRKFAEKPILIDDLRPDMIVANNIVAKSGMLIVRQEQKLTENLIQNIQQLFQNDQLRDSISVLVTFHE
jgi:response regulator RpfG family c-di-GMP phosphodiesterase